MKRFYKHVTCTQADGAFQILLDGRAVKTPDKHLFVPETRALAEAICFEWENQRDEICPETMPLTQWVSTLIDRIRPQRTNLIENILCYIDTDLICYRAPCDTEARATNAAQIQFWDPPLHWIEHRFDVSLLTTTELRPIVQPLAVHEKLREATHALSDAECAVLTLITHETGSLFLAYAFLKGAFTAESIMAAAFAEENVKSEIYNEKFYGTAPDHERRKKNLEGNLRDAKIFLSLSQQK